jgi:hypothetical protein
MPVESSNGPGHYIRYWKSTPVEAFHESACCKVRTLDPPEVAGALQLIYLSAVCTGMTILISVSKSMVFFARKAMQ